MSFIDVVDYGIIVRRQALASQSVGVDKLSVVLEFEAPLDISNDLVSFGPCFGGEAVDEFIRRLEMLGLRYMDDFFVFSGEFPLWCKFKVDMK